MSLGIKSPDSYHAITLVYVDICPDKKTKPARKKTNSGVHFFIFFNAAPESTKKSTNLLSTLDTKSNGGILHLPWKLRFSAKYSFFRQYLDRGNYQPTYQPFEGIYLLNILLQISEKWAHGCGQCWFRKSPSFGNNEETSETSSSEKRNTGWSESFQSLVSNIDGTNETDKG